MSDSSDQDEPIEVTLEQLAGYVMTAMRDGDSVESIINTLVQAGMERMEAQSFIQEVKDQLASLDDHDINSLVAQMLRDGESPESIITSLETAGMKTEDARALVNNVQSQLGRWIG